MKGYGPLIAFLVFFSFMAGVMAMGALAGLPYPDFWTWKEACE